MVQEQPHQAQQHPNRQVYLEALWRTAMMYQYPEEQAPAVRPPEHLSPNEKVEELIRFSMRIVNNIPARFHEEQIYATKRLMQYTLSDKFIKEDMEVNGMITKQHVEIKRMVDEETEIRYNIAKQNVASILGIHG